MFRTVDAATVRIAAHVWPDHGVPWSHRHDPAGVEAWLRATWRQVGMAEAVWVASPGFADRVEAALAGGRFDAGQGWRLALALARYLVRARRRATPFGLFSGVATLRFDTVAAVTSSERSAVRVRPDAEWLASLVAQLEADPKVRRGLYVQANNLARVSGLRIVVECRPHACAVTGGAFSVRRTEAVRLAMSLACGPVLWADLVDKVAASYPDFPRTSAEALVVDLVDQGVLISALRPPSTCADPIKHVLDQLDAIPHTDPGGQMVQELRALHGRLGATAGRAADVRGLAARMRELAVARQPLAVDVRLADQVVVPHQVAAEVIASVEVLRRLTPHPTGRPEWRAYQARFVDRYGMAAVVPLAEVVDPVAGLGYPEHFGSIDSPAVPLSGRDERLMALAQQALIDGVREVVLDDAAVRALAGPAHGERLVSPHVDVSAEVRAVSLRALEEGRFLVAVTGIGRSAMATSGRFLDVLPYAEREWMRREFARLPAAVEGAMPAQVSFPPRKLHAQNVLRSPQVLPWLVSIAEHRPAADNVIGLDDLGMAAGGDRLVLVSMSRRRVVEPTVAHAAAVHTMPLLARFLVELPRASDARLKPFDWGAASCLPFRPALRYGRVLLSAARWRIDPARLPAPAVSDGEWSAAWEALRERLRLPRWVQVGSGDQRLRLDLDQAMDRSLLRAHLDANSDAAVTIVEAAGLEDFGWLSGRAHEIVVPVASTAAPATAPAAVAARGSWPPPAPADPVAPGESGLLSGSLTVEPSMMELVLRRGLPALFADWPEPPMWWFIRMRRPYPHLRLRLHTYDYGQAAVRVGRWAAALRQQGLAGDLRLDTYRPETGRYGDGPAMSAAEELFAADSRAAVTQMATKDESRLDPQALTAASMIDLAAAMLGSRDDGCQWFVARPEHPGRAPIDRGVLRQAVTLDPTSLPEPVQHAWRERSRAAARYTDALSASAGALTPAGVLTSLMHLHFVRTHGPDEAAEQVTYRLARHIALAAVRRRDRITGAGR
ncbi:lantibiotic dehydratase [Micromonospora sp. C95]|uniref:lantibiotic dehydratase n=1 Tax=Micromonospora sp. C95 TaxID=2824882 RepID=UPI001B3803B9|nr:lantibiotic dehydratase [Micromonospora sp. C95]MBQ1022843.1 lantibiotic dehydratase [Micromonospora sp. C95]